MSDSKKKNEVELSELFDDIADFVINLLDEAYNKGFDDGLKAKEDKKHDG